ncbi:MAG: hypothetical protein M3Q38_02000 [Chloroflexota bacterium]|nr:hypothetical protein [Chloroflexota bacterium]
MSQTGVVVGLAVRELWISFRLLLLLTAYVAVGAASALLPASLPAILVRLAIGVSAAMIAGAAIAAWSISRDRVLGRAGWLATRSIPRGTILVGWFVALVFISVLGLVAVGLLGWLAASTASNSLDPVAFGAMFGAIACGSLALLALGLLFGAILRPLAAAVGAAAAGALIIAGAWFALPRVALPVEALVQLPRLPAPISIAVQGGGASLAFAACLVLVARAALERADL